MKKAFQNIFRPFVFFLSPLLIVIATASLCFLGVASAFSGNFADFLPLLSVFFAVILLNILLIKLVGMQVKKTISSAFEAYIDFFNPWV